MAGESSLTRTYKTLLTTTFDKLLSANVIQDNVYDAHPVLDWLRSGDRVKVIDGGERIRIPIWTGKGTTFKWYSGDELLNVTPQEGATTAWYTWKQGSVSITVDGLSRRSNKGTAQIADITKEKRKQSEMDLADNMATGMFSDGTGTSNKQLTGFEAMIATTTTSGTYADINSATNTSWRNQVATGVGSAAVNLIPKLTTVFNDCSQGKGATSRPDLIVGTQAIHESAEALINPKLRYASGANDAQMVADGLRFKTAEFIWSDYCTSGTVYVLNSSHMMFFVHRDANFSLSEEGFQKPVDQDTLVSQIFFQGNLATNNRRKLGKLTGIT
jgi:hypothetical protein|tara:strand:+ start:11353 stop:12339 length:987 start_codon:yes stop_codon:yes gene_type:complete